MASLTVKQDTFSKQYIENGGNATAAYKYAYDADNMKPETIHVKACELLKSTKVALRIKELQDAIDEEFNFSVNHRIKLLRDIALSCIKIDEDTGKMINPNAAISAIDQMNKMTGDHAAIKQKTDITSSDDSLKPTIIELVGVRPSEN